MRIVNRLEKIFGRFAIPHLMHYIIICSVVVFAISYFDPRILGIIALYPDRVLDGEIWRLVTFIFFPIGGGFLSIFAFLLYYNIGTALEREWGTFRFNLFYFTGVIGTIIASFIVGIPMHILYLNLSLFLAFARLYPDYTLMIYFVIPVKIKYLAWLNWAVFVFTMLMFPIGYKIAAFVSLANYFLFFGKDIIYRRKTARASYIRQKNYRESLKKAKPHFHQCCVCGKTEEDDPSLQFRFCSKCKGDFEYCLEHLQNHEHK